MFGHQYVHIYLFMQISHHLFKCPCIYIFMANTLKVNYYYYYIYIFCHFIANILQWVYFFVCICKKKRCNKNHFIQ